MAKDLKLVPKGLTAIPKSYEIAKAALDEFYASGGSTSPLVVDDDDDTPPEE